MLLLKKVTSNSDIESLHIQFAEQNIFLLAQDANGRQIFGRQTVLKTQKWPNSFFISPLEFNTTLLPNIQYQGQPQTATIEMTLKFNMLGNAIGMYDWIHQNQITALEDKDIAGKLQSFAHKLAAAVERHLAQADDCYLTPAELSDVFPNWLKISQINSLQIGPRIIAPPSMAAQSPKTTAQRQPQPATVPMAEQPETTANPRPRHQPPVIKTANPPNLIQKNQPQKTTRRRNGCGCSHFFMLLLLIFCIICGGLIHLVKAVKNAVVAVATPVVQLFTRPAEIRIDSAKASFMLPSRIPLELLTVKAGSYQPASPYCGVQTPSYQITIPKDFWLSGKEVTEEQWQAMMQTPLNTFGVGIDDANDFCRRLTNHFANQLPQGYHFALPTDAEWNLAVLQYKGRLSGQGRRYDIFQNRLYGFHLALVPNH